MGDFEITHTFGWFPLQQYLIPFPGGRLQTLHIAWDSRDNKWFRVPPEGTGRPRRLAVLDQCRPELEWHVRPVPLHQAGKELRPRNRQLQHYLVRYRRRLRSLSRSGLRAMLSGRKCRKWPGRTGAEF